MDTQTKIDTLTTREVNLPKIEDLPKFVEAWAEIAREGEYPKLVTEALVKILSEAYYQRYWPAKSPGEKWVSRGYWDKSWASEYYNELNLKLTQAQNLPFWKRGSEVSKIEKELAEAKDGANKARAILKETIALYREHQFPYKVAAQELCKQIGVQLKDIYSEMESREHHLPI